MGWRDAGPGCPIDTCRGYVFLVSLPTACNARTLTGWMGDRGLCLEHGV